MSNAKISLLIIVLGFIVCSFIVLNSSKTSPSGINYSNFRHKQLQQQQPFSFQISIHNESHYSHLLEKIFKECSRNPHGGKFFSLLPTSHNQKNQGETEILNLVHSIPRWSPPLKPFEVSPFELSCKKENNQKIKDKWEQLLPLPSSSRSWSFENKSEIEEPRKNFFLHSSWMFRQWLHWDSLPESTQEMDPKKEKDEENPNTPQTKKDHFFRAYHDINNSNGLYKIENFCLHPYSGLHGFVPPNFDKNTRNRFADATISSFQGREETRGFYHDEKKFAWFLDEKNVEKLNSPPKVFDKRPVIFIPVSMFSRNNVAHTLQRLMPLLGMLMKKRVLKGKLSEFGLFGRNEPPFFDFDNNEDDEADDKGQEQEAKKLDIKPLLVFVNPLSLDEKYDRKQVAAWAMYYRLFPDFPWASVLSSSGVFFEDYMKSVLINIQGRKGTPKNSSEDKIKNNEDEGEDNEVTKLMNLLRNTSNDRREGHGMLCFRKGFAWQNCRKCDFSSLSENNDPSFPEPYAFGNFAPGRTEERIQMVELYRELVLKHCLKISKNAQTSISSSPSSQQNKNRNLPKVFFDVRSRSRGILDLPLFMKDLIEARTKGYVLENRKRDGEGQEESHHLSYLWREQLKGSRSEYIRDLSESDIFIGAHGAAFGGVVLLRDENETANNKEKIQSNRRRNNVIVEFCGSLNSPKKLETRKWFRPFSAAIGIENHWTIGVNRQLSAKNSGIFLKIPPSVLSCFVMEASCRWMQIRNDDNNNFKNKFLSEKCSKPFFDLDWDPLAVATMHSKNENVQVPRPSVPSHKNRVEFDVSAPPSDVVPEISSEEEDYSYQQIEEHNLFLLRDLASLLSFGKIRLSLEETKSLEVKLRFLRVNMTRKHFIRIDQAYPHSFWELFLLHWTDGVVKMPPISEKNMGNNGENGNKIENDVNAICIPKSEMVFGANNDFDDSNAKKKTAGRRWCLNKIRISGGGK